MQRSSVRNEQTIVTNCADDNSDNGSVNPLGDVGVNTRVGKQFMIPRKVKLYERVR